MKRIFVFVASIVFSFACVTAAPAYSAQEAYTVGVDDVLEVNVLAPEKISVASIVAPDGTINLPYIGNLMVRGLSLGKIQELAESRLSEGFMKYPVVSVALKESRSKKFFVYGEVTRPGPYVLEDETTVLKAISEAGGFTKFGSASRVKILRPKGEQTGYEIKKINIRAVMEGGAGRDTVIVPGDIIVVSEGIF